MTHHLRPSRQIVAPLVLVATLVSLTACSGAGDEFARNLGLVRDAPDEFVVTTRAPLSMPSNFSTLPAPTPGVARPQERTTRDAAQLTLAPQSVGTNAPTTPTQGEAALLGAAKQDADPDVRNEVNRQATDDATKRSVWNRTPPSAARSPRAIRRSNSQNPSRTGCSAGLTARPTRQTRQRPRPAHPPMPPQRPAKAGGTSSDFPDRSCLLDRNHV